MVASVYLPHLAATVKLGRKKPSPFALKLRLGDYLTRQLPPPPDSADYTARAAKTLARVYLNDQLGDCVIAGGFHVKGVVTGNAGAELAFSDADCVTQYGAIGGYVPGRPDTDQGCNEQDALNFWTRSGFPDGSRLAGWLAVNPRDLTECRTALWLFENLYCGAELPDAWLNIRGPGFTWDRGRANPANGHAFPLFSFGPTGFGVSTWGMLGTLTNAALAGNIDELYVLLDQAMIAKGQQKAPSGLYWADLVADFDALGGNVPIPGPSPTPPPAPNVRQQVDAVFATLLKSNKRNRAATLALQSAQSQVDGLLS